MEGVQILNQFEVVTEKVFNWNTFWVAFGIGAVFSLIVAVLFGLSEQDWSAFFVALGFNVFCVCLVAGLGGAVQSIPLEYETHYEVIINEEVNMQKFMDKYEIVETRGEIYTVREK